MGSKLNRHAYEKLVAEDIEWLLKQPRTLEREHIEAVLRCSPDREYGVPEERAIKGEKSRPLYSPSRSIAQDGDQHLYVFHDGLWWHFAPKGWETPSPLLPSQAGACKHGSTSVICKYCDAETVERHQPQNYQGKP